MAVDAGACRACGLPMLWAVTPAGAKAPLEREPRTDGNVLVLKPAALGEQLLAVTLTGETLERARAGAGGRLWINHFATCPERERFKRGQSEVVR